MPSVKAAESASSTPARRTRKAAAAAAATVAASKPEITSTKARTSGRKVAAPKDDSDDAPVVKEDSIEVVLPLGWDKTASQGSTATSNGNNVEQEGGKGTPGKTAKGKKGKKAGSTKTATTGTIALVETPTKANNIAYNEESEKRKLALKEELRLRLEKAQAELNELKSNLPDTRLNGIPTGPRADGLLKKKMRPAIQLSAESEKGKKKKQKEKKQNPVEDGGATKIRRQEWRASPALGGHFLAIEPVFSKDEKYIFLAHERSVRIYSLKTSLLVRSLNLQEISDNESNVGKIVSYALDPLNPDQLYVASSDGKITSWNWVEGEKLHEVKTRHPIELMKICQEPSLVEDSNPSVGIYVISRPKQKKKALVPPKAQKKSTEEVDADGPNSGNALETLGHWELNRVVLGDEADTTQAELQLFRTFNESPITAFEVVQKGEIIVALSGYTLFIGNRTSWHVDTSTSTGTTDIYDGQSGGWGNWRYFKFTNFLTSMDIRMLNEQGLKCRGKNDNEAQGRGLLALGDLKGKIYLWHDMLREDNDGQSPEDLQPLHWHRNAVEAVKFSRDGNYIISGGSETVLVLWQIDTGHKQFLPHLTSAIENIVVSPTGTSYAVRLADNSVMALSTSELKPKANITGIQALASPGSTAVRKAREMITTVDTIDLQRAKRSKVKAGNSIKRIPCVLHPTVANYLLLATPSYSTAHLDTRSQTVTRPYLQTFDTFTDRAVSRQALTRTLATQIKVGPVGNTLLEPDVKLLAISADGEWLASLDEWSASPSTPSMNPETREGREVFLKFWKRKSSAIGSGEKEFWELVTRVDSPHPSPITAGHNGGLQVFDLISLPGKRSPAFATLGADGCVRVWKARVRTRAGVAVTKQLQVKGATTKPLVETLINWGCKKVIQFSKGHPNNITFTFGNNYILPPSNNGGSWGSIAISADSSVIAVAVPAPTPTTTTNTLSKKDEAPITPATTDEAYSSIYLISPVNATTKQVLSGLQVGYVSSIGFINQYLVIAGTTKLVLWDLVKGRIAWSYSMEELGILANPKRKREDSITGIRNKAPKRFKGKASAISRDDIFLSISTSTSTSHQASQTFALGINLTATFNSIIFIFTTTTPCPLHIATLPDGQLLAALKETPQAVAGGSDSGEARTAGGFMYLTTTSHIRYLSPLATQHLSVLSSSSIGEGGITTFSQLVEPDQPSQQTPPATALAHIYQPISTSALATEVDTDEDIDMEDIQDEWEDDDERQTAIVPFQTLEAVIDEEGPAYAIREMGGLFDKVMGLFGEKRI